MMTKKRRNLLNEYILKHGLIKNTRQLASLISFLEGKKSQARIGDIREILKIFSDIALENEDGEVDVFSEDFEL